tara:strand:+ start:203 stop:592 length:390 start_codon:yes stop_codon:yes gene_type:complete
MQVKIEKKAHKLHVYVTVTPRRRDHKMISYKTQDVLDWIKANAKQYNLEKAKLLKAPTVHNGMGPKYLSGEWIFELEHHAVKAAPKKAAPKKAAPTPLANTLVEAAPPTQKTSYTNKSKKKRKITKTEV